MLNSIATKIKPKPKPKNYRAAYELAVKLMAQMGCGQRF